MEKWLAHEFSSGVTTGEDYRKFQAAAKRSLKKIAAESGFELHRFNPNHYCFSAVLQQRSTGKFVYVSIADVRHFPGRWYHRAMIRTMAHAEDWVGGANQHCGWSVIGQTAARICK